MQHFQPILIAIGFLAIAGVLVHGFLLSRKNKLALSAEQEENEVSEFDEIETEQTESSTGTLHDIDSMAFSTDIDDENNAIDDVKFTIDAKDNALEPSITIVDEAVKDPEALNLDNDIAESNQTVATEKTDSNVAKNTTETTANTPEPASSIKTKPEVKSLESTTPTDLFIFNVVRREESRLGGHELLQFFLTSGFRFGAMGIFHRHENSDGTGEVLFSIANMMAPGTFDLDMMEQFNSQGISFFLTAPNTKISVKQSFDLMLRAVEQLADEFDCDVLNANREPLTEKQFMEYRRRLQQYP